MFQRKTIQTEVNRMAKKMFYSMGEVAEMFDVKPSLLRHWEAKFDIARMCEDSWRFVDKNR